MSKCGKGCMPECEHFTTGGCISPFNCMYKEESGYINSATSGTVIYTGGMNMTNEEMIENLKCVIADIFEQCEQLKSENAALRERLDKAIIPPCKVGDIIYIITFGYNGKCVTPDNFADCWSYGMKEVEVTEDNLFIMCSHFRDGSAFFDREAAKARLNELKGEKK